MDLAKVHEAPGIHIWMYQFLLVVVHLLLKNPWSSLEFALLMRVQVLTNWLKDIDEHATECKHVSLFIHVYF